MSKNIVFFVHGIGQHAAGWSKAADGPIAALNKAMQLYPSCFSAGKKLEDYLDLVEIRYDDIFDKVLDTWKDLGNSIPSNTGFNWVNAVSDLMKSVQGDKELFLRYGGDVLLYCGFELVARAVRLRVNSVIATRIYQAHLSAAGSPGQLPKMAVIAHSLGTTVGQDALYQLATANWLNDIATVSTQRPELTTNTNMSIDDQNHYRDLLTGAKQHPERPLQVGIDSLFLIANTRPLLKQSGDYALLTTPSDAYDCDNIYNVNHLWDPVSKICGGLTTGNPRNHWSWSNVTIRHVHEMNIHGFGHYLSNPAVHGPIFSKLLESVFTDSCYGSAKTLSQQTEWQGFGGTLANLEQQARDALANQLNNMSTGTGAKEALLRSAIEALVTQLGGV
jgi:hypothetical protein